MRKDLISFELRIFEGGRGEGDRLLLSVEFRLNGAKKGRERSASSTADGKACAVAAKIWGYLQYPTPENSELAASALSSLGGIDLIAPAAEEVGSLPQSYGLLVRKPCPALALPGAGLFEFTSGRDRPASEGWRRAGVKDVLQSVGSII